MPTQNANATQTEGGQQHVVASPNPTIDDSKKPALQTPTPATAIQPAQSTTAAPMKSTTGGRHKSKKHAVRKKSQ
jgi:hypothetical protein